MKKKQNSDRSFAQQEHFMRILTNPIIMFNKFGFTIYILSFLLLIILGIAEIAVYGSFVLLLAAAAYLLAVPIICSCLSAYSISAKDRVIIGNAFKGMDPASIKFRRALDCYNDRYFNNALFLMRQVEEYKLRDHELAVIDYYYAQIYRSMGYFTNAAVSFEKSQERYYLSPSVLLDAMRCYVEAKNLPKAEEMLDKMFELKYNERYFYFLWSEKGRMYIKSDMPDKAIEAFNTGIEKRLDLCGAYCGLALAYLMKKDAAASRGFLEKAVLTGGMSIQNGFYGYYSEIAVSCGMLDEVSDIIPPMRNESERDAVKGVSE